MNRAEDIATIDHAPPGESGDLAEERVAVATQWQLMWWRFRKHKLAVASAVRARCSSGPQANRRTAWPKAASAQPSSRPL